MTFDIVMVTYNSEKWLRPCIAALAAQSFALKNLNIYIVDNASSDATTATVRELQKKHTAFGAFECLSLKKNRGFGYGCNRGAKRGSGGYVFFLNVDTEVFPSMFEELAAFIEAHPQGGGFECRQLPYEMGHHYDPVTLETAWASAAALAVKRDIFEKIGGFDEHLFMYCEDVDLSWRIRAEGRPLYYVPQAAVTHHVLRRGEDTSLREYSYTWLNELLLRYKFGTFRQIWQGNRLYLKELRHPRHFDGVRKALLRRYISHFYKLWPFLFWRLWHKGGARRVPARFENGFEAERGRAVWEPAAYCPLISVVIRTCSRPATLQKTLECLRHQTYKNFEIIVTEDGPDTARQMIERQFADLPVRYYASGERRGRGKNGNYGLSAAKGEYCNFLDDDDYFYADHLELMAQAAAKHPEADLILGCAMAMKVRTVQKDPYRFEVKEIFPMRFDRVDLFTMCQTCQIPIQSAMFKKSLFEKYGGLDERLEGNEDWAMWMKFLSHGKRIDPAHVDIHRATSIFVLPAGEKDAEERLEKYKIYDEAFFNDPEMEFRVSLAQMRKFYKDVLGDVAHLQRRGELEAFLEKHLKG